MEHKSYHRFEDFDLSRKLQEAVMDARLERPTELQLEVIPQALEGKDVIFEARSGMGKSACFAIPFLQHWLRDRNSKGVIITPSADSVQQLGKVIGRLCPSLKAKVLKFTARDDYFYPELHSKCPMVILEFAVADRFIKREKEFMASVHSLGLDEIDTLMGKGQALDDLIQSINADRQTLICANELTEAVIEKGRWFCDPNKMVKVQLFRPEASWDKEQIQLRYLVVNETTRADRVVSLLKENSDKIVMIVTDADRLSREIVEMLAAREITGQVLAYSMQLDEKQAIANTVVESGKGILVGCEAAMNGLNLPKVDHLISWELPSQLEQYWKRVDRFVFQGSLLVTAIVDEPRAGAVRILERRLGRPMIWLNQGEPGISIGERGERGERSDRRDRDDRGYRDDRRDRGDRGERRFGRDRDRRDDRYDRRNAPDAGERTPPASSTPSESFKESKPQQNPNEPVIPGRFFEPVSAEPDEMAKYAPTGKIIKTLGSKFVPAGKKRSGKQPGKPPKSE
jgi:superfamily II DNA/RNA helicase